MKRAYFFSDKLKTDFLKEIPEIQTGLEIIKSERLNARDTLSRGFDYVFLAEGDFEEFKPEMKAITWKTSHIGVADTLMKVEGGYKPLNLNADCVLQVLRSRNFKLDTAQAAMIIGSYDFALSVATKLALSGYSKLLISLDRPERMKELEMKLAEFVFGLDLRSVPLNDLTLLQTASALLISNVTPEMNSEAYEALTYFNFLSRGGVFVDFQSYSNTTLIEEAKRAELNTVEELEILTLKLKSLL